MKIQTIGYGLLTAAFLMAGEVTQAKEKPVLERGWIGGRYECAKNGWTLAEKLFGSDHMLYTLPGGLAKTQTAGFLLTALGTNTPAYLAGLREGDLIVDLDHQPVRDLPEFWQVVTARQPGETLVATVYRKGTNVDCPVIVGCEKYKHLGYFSIGLPMFWGPLHLVPTGEAPCFSLMALGYEKKRIAPEEFASVKKTYEHNCHPQDKQTGYDTDWRCWLAIFEVKKGKQILAQEIVPARKRPAHRELSV